MIILSLGSNLPSKFGDRFDNLELAMSHLMSNEVVINKRSSFYETPSYPNKNNPKFINIVIQAETNLPPEDLASVLIYVEEKIERKREIDKLIGRINREGLTLIPTKLYFKKGKAKVEIAVAKGKKQFDKRHVKKKRDWNREKARFFRKSS